VIYFVQAEGSDHVKIGWSDKSIERRVAALQVGNSARLVLLRTMEGNEWYEKNLHTLFSDVRIRGEWFHISPNDVLSIAPEWPREGRFQYDFDDADYLDCLRESLADESTQQILRGMAFFAFSGFSAKSASVRLSRECQRLLVRCMFDGLAWSEARVLVLRAAEGVDFPRREHMLTGGFM